MKKVYLTAILAAAMLSQAQARIGFSLDQCRERYGKEVKTEAAWSSPSQTAYGFVAGKLYIYAILSSEGKVVDITYFDNTAKAALPAASQTKLWRENVDKSRVWDDTFYRVLALNTGWDGTHAHKKLGQESGPHWVMFEANGPSALVKNAKDLGWQIRTLTQFDLEQTAIKNSLGR